MVRGFPKMPTPEPKPAEFKAQLPPTVPVESIEYDEDGRRILTEPLKPTVVRPPATTVAAPSRPGGFPKAGPPPRPPESLIYPNGRPQPVPVQPLSSTAAPAKPFTTARALRPMAFRNGVPVDLKPEDIPY